MLIDLREKYIHTQLETNMSLFCDNNYKLVQFFYNNMKYKIPFYHKNVDAIYVYYFDKIIILPTSLTVYKL